MQMPRLRPNRPASLCTARNPTQIKASKQLTAQLERHPDPYLGRLKPASCRALPDDHAAALARMASKAATLEAIRKLCSALLETPILHVPVYHSLCAAARMTNRRSRSDDRPRLASPPAVAQQEKLRNLLTPRRAQYVHRFTPNTSMGCLRPARVYEQIELFAAGMALLCNTPSSKRMTS